jgi:hypothetical protein
MKSWHGNYQQHTLDLLPLPWGEGWGEGLCASNQSRNPSPGTACRPLPRGEVKSVVEDIL